MSVGLLAVVDDVLSAAVKASAKAAGVVIDDAAVTPQYVQGLTPARELPVVGRIALGSIANKFVIIIPVALLLTAFAPWVLPYLLIVGGTYLCFEGAEKVLEWFGFGHGHAGEGERDEKRLVWGAIRTDLILSTEIMLISLASLDPDLGIWQTLGVLAVIAVIMTVIVYGAVALLVKVDDIGLRMAKNPARRVRHAGMRIVRSMPAVFRVISVIGTVAMLWVGGHLIVVNLGDVGLTGPAELLHGGEELLAPLGGIITWVGGTAFSAVAGLVVGLVVVGVVLGAGRMIGKRPNLDEGRRVEGSAAG
jgi:predicted DNA repair protein MutK